MAFTKVVGAGIHTLAQLQTHNIHSAGIVTATKFVGEMESGGGDSTFQNVTIAGNLTVNGTTTTLDTDLMGVDKLEIAANNTTVGAAITQSGSGGILRLFDSTTQVFSVEDGGAITASGSITANNTLTVAEDITIKNAKSLYLANDAENKSARIYNSAGTGAANLTFMTVPSGGSEATRLKLTSTGQVRIDGSTSANHGLRFTPGGWNGYDNRMGFCGTSGGDFWWSSNWNPTDGSRDHSGYATNFIRQNVPSGYISFGTGAVDTSASERLRITSDGELLVGGYGTSIEPDGYASHLQVHGTATDAGISILRYSNNAGGPTLLFGKSRGASIGAFTKVHDGDSLGKIEFYGTDTDWESSASVRACADGEWYSGSVGSEDNTDAPGRLEFHTTPNGADNMLERLRIDSSGRVIITNDSVTHSTGTNTQYAPLVVRGNTSATSSRAAFINFARSEASANIAVDEGIGEIWFGDQQAGEYGAIKCTADAAAAVGDYPGRLTFHTTADGGTTMHERVRIDSAGSVRIGNTTQNQYTAADDLIVGTGSGNRGITIYSGSSDSGVIAFSDGTVDTAYRSGQIIYDHNGDTMDFRTNGNNVRLTITSTGKVGAGKVGATRTLHVASDDDLTTFTGGSYGAFAIENSQWDNGDYTAMDFLYNGTNRPVSRIASKITSSGASLHFGVSNSYATGITHEAMMINYEGSIRIGAGSIALPKATAGGVDIASGSQTACLGGNVNSSGRTNSTDKLARITSPHYTNAEESVMMISAYNQSGNNNIGYGGGSSTTNTATQHTFYTAADTTTVTGDERLRIQSNGRILIAKGTADTTTSQIQIGDPSTGYTWDVGDTPQVLIAGVNNESPTSGTLNIALRVADENNNNMFQIHNRGGGNTDVGEVYIAGKVHIGTNTEGAANLMIYGDGTTDNKPATIYQNSGTGTGTSNGLYVGINHNDAVGYIWNYEAEPLVFATQNNERMRIDKNGKVYVAAGELHPTRVLAQFGIDCQGRDIYDGVGTVSNYGMAFYNDPNPDKANGIGFFNDDGQTCGGYIVHQDKGSGNLGDLIFATSETSNTPQEVLRINSTGAVTTPKQPAFKVTGHNNNWAHMDVVGWYAFDDGSNGASPRVDANWHWHNKGFNYGGSSNSGCFSTTTGRFTAPVAGHYYFWYIYYMQRNGGNSDQSSYIHINPCINAANSGGANGTGIQDDYTIYGRTNYYASQNNLNGVTGHWGGWLAAGDTFEFKTYNGRATNGFDIYFGHSAWGGWLNG